jgi:hypothetical protein
MVPLESQEGFLIVSVNLTFFYLAYDFSLYHVKGFCVP